MYFDKPDGFTRADMEAEIKAMSLEALRAEVTAAGLRDGMEQLRNLLIYGILEEAGIKEGDKCVMHFTDGDETVEFAMVKRGQLAVRHYGSNGKPNKREIRYDYTYAELLEKLDHRKPPAE